MVRVQIRYIVLEYVPGGELFQYIHYHGPLPENEALKIFRQIISGIDYCQKFRICHRDLKPENILLDENGDVKIVDFGMAALQPRGHWLKTACGSPHYAAPEVIMGQGYDGSKADIWSCGIILFALLSGYLPFSCSGTSAILRSILRGHYTIPDDLSPDAKDLIERMLTINPEERICMVEIWHHPLVARYAPINRITGEEMDRGPRPLSMEDVALIRHRDIDVDICRSIIKLWPGMSPEKLILQLTNDKPNPEKRIYHLLYEYREEQLENYSGPAHTICYQPRRQLSNRSANAHRNGIVQVRRRSSERNEVPQSAVSTDYSRTNRYQNRPPSATDTIDSMASQRRKRVARRSVVTPVTHNDNHAIGTTGRTEFVRTRSARKRCEWFANRSKSSRHERRISYSSDDEPWEDFDEQFSDLQHPDEEYYESPVKQAQRRKELSRRRSGAVVNGKIVEASDDHEMSTLLRSNRLREQNREFKMRRDGESESSFFSAFAHSAFGDKYMDSAADNVSDNGSQENESNSSSSWQLPMDGEMLPNFNNCEGRRRNFRGKGTSSRMSARDIFNNEDGIPGYPLILGDVLEEVDHLLRGASLQSRGASASVDLSLNRREEQGRHIASGDRSHTMPISSPCRASSSMVPVRASTVGYHGNLVSRNTVLVQDSVQPPPLNVRRKSVRNAWGQVVQNPYLRYEDALANNQAGNSSDQGGHENDRAGPSLGIRESGCSQIRKKRSFLDILTGKKASKEGSAKTDVKKHQEALMSGAKIPFAAQQRTVLSDVSGGDSLIGTIGKRMFRRFQVQKVQEVPVERPGDPVGARFSIESDRDFFEDGIQDPAEYNENQFTDVVVHKNWLYRVLNIKPATHIICFTVSAPRTQKAVINLWQEWAAHGFAVLKDDRKNLVVRACVKTPNTLKIKEVTFFGEVRAYGGSQKLGSGVVRFTQEKGAASSFNQIMEYMENVFVEKELVVLDKFRSRRMKQKFA